MILGDILAEAKPLMSVIASKYSYSEESHEDLMQDARVAFIKALPKFDPKMGKKAYSFFSIVIRNAIVDTVRKEKPEIEIDEETEADSSHPSDAEFAEDLVEGLQDWFSQRFPTLVPNGKSVEVLECIITNLLDTKCKQRKLISDIAAAYDYSYADARIIYQAILLKLRMLLKSRIEKMGPAAERSLQPELLTILGLNTYQEAMGVFDGISVRFESKSKRNGLGKSDS
jgi:RNA polymerase sigma factor (sigma-70 family)